MRYRFALLLVLIIGMLLSWQFSWALSKEESPGPEEQVVHAYNQHNLYYEPGPTYHFGK